jgi:nicotinamide mononucleotide adenylyltransferase
MSGAAGGSRINKENLKDTIRDYRNNILKPLGLDKSYKITGVRSRPEKNIFGDIDVVVSFPGGDKKELKQNLANFLEQVNEIPEIPSKNNKKYFIHGSIVSILYPIAGKENEYVQIDNIVTSSQEEGKFTYKMLDLPAQEQGLALGLVKAIFSELDENQIQKLFRDLNIPKDIEQPGEGEEYDFSLNPSELTLSIVPIGKGGGQIIWKSSKFSDVKTILDALGIDIEKDKFDTIISKIKKFKNRRSIDRLKGMFTKNIRVGNAEVGLDKGIKKQQSLDTVNSLEETYTNLTEEEKSTIAVFPGKFKPPHKDHLARIKAAANSAGQVLVIIGPKPTDSFTAEQTLNIFNLFKSKGLVPNNVTFVISDLPSPVLKAYKEFENHPDQQYIAVFGKDDVDRFKGISKLSNVKVDNFEEANIGTLSATDLRNAILNGDLKTIQSMIPKEIDAKEYIQALNIEQLNENASYAKDIDYKQYIKELTKDMIRKGMNVTPLPKVIFKHSDVSNAKDFFGKTAYYEPQSMSIVLYTEGRHPKDIVRSFAHEMIHHMQNVEGRLGDITTTNTQEDDRLNDLEAEANLKGTMTFRNWTDGLNEAIVGNKIVCDNCGWSWNIEDGGDSLYICHKCGHNNNPIQEKKNKDPFGITAYALELARGLE